MKYSLLSLIPLTLSSLASAPTTAPASDAPYAYRNVGPVSIAGYRAPTFGLSAEASSRVKLQNANPYDLYFPCYYGGYFGAWGCFYHTPYGVIQSSGSLPW